MDLEDDDGWLNRMTPDERQSFLAGSQTFFALQEELKSTSHAATLERSIVDSEDPAQAREYWRALANHNFRMAELHNGIADAMARMARALDRQAGI